MEDYKRFYYTGFCNTITNFNDRNNTTLSNMKILEEFLRVMIEDEEGEITYSNSVTADTCNLASIS